MESITASLLSGNRRAIARAISIVEDGGQDACTLSRTIYPHSGNAHIVGVTGSPGVGKSTLVDALISEMRRDGLRVGVLAVDPSSPFTGGAILGDRIRMQEHTLDKDVFIRSMANRGHAGGCALATFDAARLLDASGYDVIVIETVGVGQSELSIARTADTTILVLMPGSGDEIQAIKSGIMEIGDVFVVNKSDLPGANKTATDIMNSLELAGPASGWRPPVILSQSQSGAGVGEVWAAVKSHFQFLEQSGALALRRRAHVQSEIEELVADMARNSLKDSLTRAPHLHRLLDQVVKREVDPHTAASELIGEIFADRQG